MEYVLLHVYRKQTPNAHSVNNKVYVRAERDQYMSGNPLIYYDNTTLLYIWLFLMTTVAATTITNGHREAKTQCIHKFTEKKRRSAEC